jgi:hypothetical protein
MELCCEIFHSPPWRRAGIVEAAWPAARVARPRPSADEENDPNILNSKIHTRKRSDHQATSQCDKTGKALDRLGGGAKSLL